MAGENPSVRCTGCGTVTQPRPVKDADFVRCTACGLLLRVWTSNINERQAILDATLKPIADLGGPYPDHPEVIEELDFFYRHLGCDPAGLHIFEVGSGTGNVMANLRKRGAQPVGIEPFRPHAEIARAAGLDVRVGRFNEEIRKEFGAHSFDAVIFGDTLNYVDDQGRALALTHELLRPDGILFISSLVADSPYYWRGAPLIDRVGRYATVFFERGTLIAAVERCGFKIIATGKQPVLVSHAVAGWRLGGVVAYLAKRLLPLIAHLLPPDRLLLAARPVT